jgi:hypothetical protein
VLALKLEIYDKPMKNERGRRMLGRGEGRYGDGQMERVRYGGEVL